MVSRANLNQKAAQNARRRPHYGLRKLSVGVASVLLGATLYLGGTNIEAHAAVANATDNATTQSQLTTSKGQQDKSAQNLDTTGHQGWSAQALASMKATNVDDNGQIDQVTNDIFYRSYNKTIQEQITYHNPDNSTLSKSISETYSTTAFDGVVNQVHTGSQVITTSGQVFYGQVDNDKGNKTGATSFQLAYLNGKVLFINGTQIVLETTPSTLTDQQIAKVMPVAKFDEYRIDQKQGYESYYSLNGGPRTKGTVISAQSRLFDQPNIKVDIYYKEIKKSTVTVQLVDDDNNSAPVGTPVSAQGIPGESHTFNLSVPPHYRLVTGKSSFNHTFTGNNEALTIHLVHQTQPASRTASVTRTIHYEGAGTSTPRDTVQTANFTQTGTTDLVTGKTSWNNVTNQTFGEVTSPTVAGYKPDTDKVKSVSVKYVDQSSRIIVKYLPQLQTGNIIYVDVDNGNAEVGPRTPLNGRTGDDVTVTPHIPAGYKRVLNQNIPSTEKATVNGIPDVTVKIEHTTTTVQPTDPKTPADKLPDNPGKKYPEGVAEKDLNKTITRQITVVKPDGTREDHSQSVHLTRTATVDEVTGKVTYGNWTTGSMDDYSAPTVAGYHADKN
uniref:mucin-binding protein n=1 Tax=uncultured Limosilactobacillus sp. TaxID=2837629 RepID=UPI0025D62579